MTYRTTRWIVLQKGTVSLTGVWIGPLVRCNSHSSQKLSWFPRKLLSISMSGEGGLSL
jgi:hypothetical protein